MVKIPKATRVAIDRTCEKTKKALLTLTLTGHHAAGKTRRKMMEHKPSTDYYLLANVGHANSSSDGEIDEARKIPSTMSIGTGLVDQAGSGEEETASSEGHEEEACIPSPSRQGPNKDPESDNKKSIFSREPNNQVFVILSIMIATLYQHWEIVVSEGSVPLHVGSLWFVLGALMGRILSPKHHVPNQDKKVYATKVQTTTDATTQETQKDFIVQKPSTRLYRFFERFGIPIKGGEIGNDEDSDIQDFSLATYTNLFPSTKRAKKYWEKHIDDRPTNDLMTRLLRYKDFTTKPRPPRSVENETTLQSTATDNTVLIDNNGKDEGGNSLGLMDTKNHFASVLGADIEVDPLFKLRGMDVFKTVNGFPEEKIWRQPVLEKGGLRDVPTFVANLMLPWGNLVLYFEMPSWVQRFSDIKVEKDDSEDIKALKLFLLGDETYRNPRWKLLPCLVDGPFIIKAMAPPKTEITVAGNRIPLTWHQYDQSVDKTGKTRAALLEADCDLISDSAVRKITNIVRGQVKKVKIDCAMIIDKPYLSTDDEPSACIGLWRMDRVDMKQTAILPEKDERELLREASVLFPDEIKSSIKHLLQNPEGISVAAGM